MVLRNILPGSPAEKAGLKPGDILIAFNGKPIQGPRALVRQLASTAVGAKVEIKVLRDQKEQLISVTLEEQPTGFKPGAPQPSQIPPALPAPQLQQPLSPTQAHPLVGVSVSVIPADVRANYPENVQGVWVKSIEKATPSASVLQPGDVIEQINGQAVEDVSKFAQITASLKQGSAVILSIARGKVRFFAVVQAR